MNPPFCLVQMPLNSVHQSNVWKKSNRPKFIQYKNLGQMFHIGLVIHNAVNKSHTKKKVLPQIDGQDYPNHQTGYILSKPAQWLESYTTIYLLYNSRNIQTATLDRHARRLASQPMKITNQMISQLKQKLFLALTIVYLILKNLEQVNFSGEKESQLIYNCETVQDVTSYQRETEVCMMLKNHGL